MPYPPPRDGDTNPLELRKQADQAEGYVIFCDSSKVHFLDMNKTAGEETQQKFNNHYGSGKAKFVCCDVTSQEQLEGH